jgi:hypothetical protein
MSHGLCYMVKAYKDRQRNVALTHTHLFGTSEKPYKLYITHLACVVARAAILHSMHEWHALHDTISPGIKINQVTRRYHCFCIVVSWVRLQRRKCRGHALFSWAPRLFAVAAGPFLLLARFLPLSRFLLAMSFGLRLLLLMRPCLLVNVCLLLVWCTVA